MARRSYICAASVALPWRSRRSARSLDAGPEPGAWLGTQAARHASAIPARSGIRKDVRRWKAGCMFGRCRGKLKATLRMACCLRPEIIVPAGPGRIDVVATPIGNLADLSPRARETLAAADLVAAEDTRHTGAMLRTLGIDKLLVSLHEYNEGGRRDELVEQLVRGARIALVSDAGTPLVSDPGFLLVRAALDAGIAVHAVPGPSAVLAALATSGLAPDRFCFEGFLPARTAARREQLRALRARATHAGVLRGAAPDHGNPRWISDRNWVESGAPPWRARSPRSMKAYTGAASTSCWISVARTRISREGRSRWW